MLTTLLTAVIVAAPVRPEIFDKYPTYDTTKTRFAVSYQPGGRTVKQAWEKVDEFTPNENVVAVINGGYFAPDAKPIVAVDLVVSKGVELVPYRFDLSRPIIAFGDGRVAIFTGKDGEAYAKLKRYQEAGGYYHAMAGDSKPQEPGNARERRIIGLRGNELVDIKLMEATWARCQKVIAEQQLDRWIYLDGGSSVYRGVKVPTHVVALVPKEEPPIQSDG